MFKRFLQDWGQESKQGFKGASFANQCRQRYITASCASSAGTQRVLQISVCCSKILEVAAGTLSLYYIVNAKSKMLSASIDLSPPLLEPCMQI